MSPIFDKTPPEKPRTVVEFVDPSGVDNYLHKARELRINGTPVMVEADSVDLKFGPQDATRLTITLLPDAVHFVRKDF